MSEEPSYIIKECSDEAEPCRNNRCPFGSDIIATGQLMFGSSVYNVQRGRWFFKHLKCTTKTQFQNCIGVYGCITKIQGFELLDISQQNSVVSEYNRKMA